MVRGLYTAATGMLVQTTRMDLISNDLANVNTTAYKKDVAVAESFDEVLMKRLYGPQDSPFQLVDIGSMTYGAKISDVYTHYMQGSLIKTDHNNNLALQGDGFFQVETDAGVRLTRDGGFSIDQTGALVTKEGYGVMGEDGPINLGADFFESGSPMYIRQDGQIQVGDEIVDTLSIVNVEDPQMLIKGADNLYEAQGDTIASTATVLQGYLESSNVNPVTAMVDMITVSRIYEASQRMVQVHDELLNKAVNEVGKA
ncbi:MAG: flagellar basal body protein [Epulopiscium sp. Nuni2H_MBin003]|nr:MAG: flagellar basal body protein [Epulopiscium sp. Nuni2H_MBin003]